MISIIIPAYNEEKRIVKTLEQYCELFLNEEIIVSLNACTDRTLDIVKTFQKTYPNLKYIESEIAGKGLAIIKGFSIAKGDYIGFVDADCSTSANEFKRLYNTLRFTVISIEEPHSYDGIIGSRYLKGSIVEPKQSRARIIFSRIFNSFVKIILGLKYQDTQCGAKLFKREAIQKCLPYVTTAKWAFDIDLLYQMKRNRFIIKEFPIEWRDSMYSTLNISKAAPNMLLAILKIKFT